jgi:predicted lipoprotein with Yx(FWY)xxD motif
MRHRTPAVALLLMLAFAGCSKADEAETDSSAPASTPTSEPAAKAEPAAKGTKIVVRDSEFGRMLFNSKRQAIYIFDNDTKNKSNCYGECAVAWPPVFTKGKPVAGSGVRERLLGTTTRRNGKKQVTYKGQPLYYYDHEGPGEVLCHDVFLNGGYWWVVGPNGKRRP